MLDRISLSILMESNYFIAAIAALALLASELVVLSRGGHYDCTNTQHVLNRKFGLDKKKSLDAKKVNKTIGYTNIFAILFGCIAICIHVRYGVMFLLIIYMASNVAVIYYLGYKYKNI